MGSGQSVLHCGTDQNVLDPHKYQGPHTSHPPFSNRKPENFPIIIPKRVVDEPEDLAPLTTTRRNRRQTTSHVIRVALRHGDEVDRDLDNMPSNPEDCDACSARGKVNHPFLTKQSFSDRTTAFPDTPTIPSIDDTLQSIQFISQFEDGIPVSAHSYTSSVMSARMRRSTRPHQNSGTGTMKPSRISSSSNSSSQTNTAVSSGKNSTTGESLNELIDIYPTPWSPDSNQSFVTKNTISRSSLRQLCREKNIDMRRYADLRASILAKFIPESQLLELCMPCTQMTFSAGEVISSFQKPFTSLYIIRSGIVEVSVQSASKALASPLPIPRQSLQGPSSSNEPSYRSLANTSNTSSGNKSPQIDSPSPAQSPSNNNGTQHSQRKSWSSLGNNDFTISGPDLRRLATFSQTNVFGFQPLHASSYYTNQATSEPNLQHSESTKSFTRFPTVSKAQSIFKKPPLTSPQTLTPTDHSNTKVFSQAENIQVTAVTNCSCLVIPHTAFETFFITYPSARPTLLSALNGSIVNKFASFQWLAPLPRPDLELLCSLFQLTTYEPHTTIIHEGQRLNEDSSWYYVLSGELNMDTIDLIGNRCSEHLSEGSIFGEIPLFLNISQFCTVTTLTPCLIFAIPRKNFLSSMENFPQLTACLSQRLVSVQHQVRFTTILENSLILENFQSHLQQFGGTSKNLLTFFDEVKVFRESHCSREQLHSAAKDIFTSFLTSAAPRAIPLADSLKSDIGRQLSISGAVTRDLFSKLRLEAEKLLQDYFFKMYCSSDAWKKCVQSLHQLEKRCGTQFERGPCLKSSSYSSNNLSLPILKLPTIHGNNEDISASPSNPNVQSDASPASSSGGNNGNLFATDTARSLSQQKGTSGNPLSTTPSNKQINSKHAKKWTWQADELQAISRAIMNSDMNSSTLTKTTTNMSTSTSFPLSTPFLSPSLKTAFNTLTTSLDGRTLTRNAYSRTNSKSPVESSVSQSKSSQHISEETLS